MKAEELMIGDWVGIEYYATEVAIDGVIKAEKKIRLCKVVGTSDYLVTVNRLDGKVRDCLVADLIPVSLTAEILEKNGFEVLNRYIWEQRCNRCCVRLYIAPKEEIEEGLLDERPVLLRINGATFDINMIVDYVHELQHALRLCGVEKEINIINHEQYRENTDKEQSEVV